MDAIVAKFGGTSVADAHQIQKVARIIRCNPKRRVIIVSAPGKRNSRDEKITDILISCHSLAQRGEDFRQRFAFVRSRFHELANDLGIVGGMDSRIDQVEEDIAKGADYNAVVSRGEFLAARMIARYLDFEFIDAADLITFRNPSELDESLTDQNFAHRIKANASYVIPGFYGARNDGHIQLFTRGGSDISAALAARGIDANLYENWTDVSGILSADPRYIDNPAPIASLSYRKLRELAYLGAAVFHEEAVAPAASRNIAINIRNTNEPEHPGTMISDTEEDSRSLTGVASRRGFRGIVLEKTMINKDNNFSRLFHDLLKRRELRLFHSSTGCESLFAVVEGNTDWTSLKRELHDDLGCSSADCGFETAVVGAVGENISGNTAFLSQAFEELKQEDINLYAARADYSPCSLMFFVSGDDEIAALRALYRSG